MGIHNEGVYAAGHGEIKFLGGNVAIGRNAHVESAAPSRTTQHVESWNIGVITALSVEMREVVAMLRRIGDVTKQTLPGGQRFHECQVSIDGGQLKIVGTQSLSPGQRSAMVALQNLRAHYSPEWVVLIGIAGGIHPDLRIGDVVIAQEVIYYDIRKETSHHVRRRGQSQQIPAPASHAVNDFFADHDKPCQLRAEPGGGEDFQVLAGPIGSGEAVVADRGADIRAYVSSYNDKTLALETEAGGVAQAFHEGVHGQDTSPNWMVIRGISDNADSEKDDAFHGLAARHAAKVLEELLPYLIVVSGRGDDR